MANPGPMRPVDALFPYRRAAIENDQCSICGGGAKDFVNEISRREYLISGMCQECQNATFDESEE